MVLDALVGAGVSCCDGFETATRGLQAVYDRASGPEVHLAAPRLTIVPMPTPPATRNVCDDPAMCGRMTMRTNPSELAQIFDAELRDNEAETLYELGPRYNVAPTQPIPVIVQRDDGRAFEMHRWGIVPSWSESMASAGARYINARGETVATSPVFRNSFLRRRCVIPADGFYEWRRDGKRKLPFLIHTPADAPLAFAGLWAPWKNPADGQWLLSAAVVTTQANATVSELHNRMPVILDEEAWHLWLDPDLREVGLLASLLVPAPDELLELRPASPLVNNANNEGAALLLAPADGAPADDDRPRAPAGPALTLFD